MALVNIRIGSAVDIFSYDDGDFDSSIETTAPIKSGTPIDPTDVTRLEDIEGRVLNPHPVANIDNPTELGSVDGVLGAMILAYQIAGATGLNEYTLYAYDASGPAVSAPYVMDAGGSGDERWIAIGGKYNYWDVLLGFVLGPSSATDNAIARHDGTTGKLIQNSTLFLDDSGNLSKSTADLLLDCGANKTLELTQVVYDDLRFPTNSIKAAGSFPASDVSFKGGYVLEFNSGPNNQSVYFDAQLPHNYKEGTDLVFHIHWTIDVNGAGAGAENVKWDFTYSISAADGSFPAESSATTTIDVQNDSADDHLKDTIVTINGAGLTISNVIICSLTRDVSVANDYSNSAYLISADFHFQKNTLGSRQLLVK